MKTPNETDEAYDFLEELIHTAKDPTALSSWLDTFPEVHARLKKAVRPRLIPSQKLSPKERALEKKKMDQILKYLDHKNPVHRKTVILMATLLARVVHHLYTHGTFDADGNFTPPPPFPPQNDWLSLLARATQGCPRHN